LARSYTLNARDVEGENADLGKILIRHVQYLQRAVCGLVCCASLERGAFSREEARQGFTVLSMALGGRRKGRNVWKWRKSNDDG